MSATTSIMQVYERNQEATIYVGNLDPKVDEELCWELMTQCAPVANIHLPRDKITNMHQGYGFVEFKNEEDADYTIKILNMIRLVGKPIRCNKSSQDKKTNEVGANLFIGNLEPEVDEKMLYDTFTAFGVLLFAKVMRDPDTGQSRGFGFISYDSFEGSDAALSGMNGQFLCNRPISVSYAYKKETKGERHGSAAERLIAANRPMEAPRPAAAPAGGIMPNMPKKEEPLPDPKRKADFPADGGLKRSRDEMPPAPTLRPPSLPPGMPPPPGMGGGGGPPGMPPKMAPPPGMPPPK